MGPQGSTTHPNVVALSGRRVHRPPTTMLPGVQSPRPSQGLLPRPHSSLRPVSGQPPPQAPPSLPNLEEDFGGPPHPFPHHQVGREVAGPLFHSSGDPTPGLVPGGLLREKGLRPAPRCRLLARLAASLPHRLLDAHSRGSISVFGANRRQEGGGHTWADDHYPPPRPGGRGPLSSRLMGCQQAGGTGRVRGKGQPGRKGWKGALIPPRLSVDPSPSFSAPMGCATCLPLFAIHPPPARASSPSLGLCLSLDPGCVQPAPTLPPGPVYVSADRERPLVPVQGLGA